MRDASTLPGWPAALRRIKAAAYLDISPSTLDAAVKAGIIPKPVVIYGSIEAWPRETLDAFLADRRAASGGEADANEWDAAS